MMGKESLPIALTLGRGLALVQLWLPGGGFSARTAPTAELRVCPTGCTGSTIQAAEDVADLVDVIKVAQGTRSDVHARAGISQIVYLSKTVTMRGGLSLQSREVPQA